jgi:cytoskeletal protein RodZ
MGLKKTSDAVAISFTITEAVVDTFVQEQINLTLDILNQEVFVVLAVDLDASIPSSIAGLNTQTQMSVTTTTQTAVQTLANTNCIAEERNQIAVDAAVPGTSVLMQQSNGSTPTALLPYVGIIATNNFFVQLKGNNNLTARTGSGRLWGYRAKADGSTYSALVASEVLSSQ